jgi:hypothetical protein
LRTFALFGHAPYPSQPSHYSPRVAFAAAAGPGAALAACDALKSACPDGPDDGDEQYEVLYLQHWDLREKINRIPATTIKGLRVKARAAEFAINSDPDTECAGDGCFIDLCRSINRDIFSMDAA